MNEPIYPPNTQPIENSQSFLTPYHLCKVCGCVFGSIGHHMSHMESQHALTQNTQHISMATINDLPPEHQRKCKSIVITHSIDKHSQKGTNLGRPKKFQHPREGCRGALMVLG